MATQDSGLNAFSDFEFEFTPPTLLFANDAFDHSIVDDTMFENIAPALSLNQVLDLHASEGTGCISEVNPWHLESWDNLDFDPAFECFQDGEHVEKLGLIDECVTEWPIPQASLELENRPDSMLTWVHGPTTRRRQPRIPDEPKKILTKFYSHTPYPSADDFATLSQQTELEVKRIQNWFSNTRARQPCQNAEGATARLSRDSLEELSKCLNDQSHQQLPMEAWISSLDDPYTACAQNNQIEDVRPPKRSTAVVSNTPSIVFPTAASSAGSNATKESRTSNSSKGSNASSHRSRRRGRKRVAPSNPYPTSLDRHSARLELHKARLFAAATNELQSVQRERPYFCTFCGSRFKNLYEWTRHEESIHVPQEIWVCCPNSAASFAICPFCPVTEPNIHLETHGYAACQSKPDAERTFFRRDQFVQHLRNAHSCKDDPSVTTSRSPVYQSAALTILIDASRHATLPLPQLDPALHCGFCGVWLRTWAERREHVSRHFRANGYLASSSWWPERGPENLESPITPTRVCLYCHRSLPLGFQMHRCQTWSCRFLVDMASLMRPDNFGDLTLLPFVTTDYYNSYRNCHQDFFGDCDTFIDHLTTFHGADAASCMKDTEFLGQHFSKWKESIESPASIPLGTMDEIVTETCDQETQPLTVSLPFLNMSTLSVSHSTLFRIEPEEPRYFLKYSVDNEQLSKPTSSLLYLKRASSTILEWLSTAVGLVEIEKGHLGSLIMSTALVGLASTGISPRVVCDHQCGILEFTSED